jgi:galactitol-specific phosphotransferase system IIC component
LSKIVKKYGQKVVQMLQKVVKKVSKSFKKSCQKVVKKFKIQQPVVGGGVGWGNSSSKAFGISFADRPKAKRHGMETLTNC